MTQQSIETLGKPDAQSGIDYAAVWAAVKSPAGSLEASDLVRELDLLWTRAYKNRTPRVTGILAVTVGTFEYVFDDLASLEAEGLVFEDSLTESRLVCVCGHSNPQQKKRDDYRLRGWVGRTNQAFGTGWDKGHYIGNALGGAIDRLEINVFVQRRDLNRGWSQEGKRYRAMEHHCAQNSGTFCFSRPIYDDMTARPAFLEFGVLRPNGELWVERFDNRITTTTT